MCGIVGALAFEDSTRPVDEAYIAAMRDAMPHRGPDGAGAWVSSDGRVGLGHRRLSIVDLSELAAQPMSNEDGSLQVVFNGEIYNHAEIRAELQAIGGHRWRTDHSDTEVIVHAWEQWGPEALHRFRGMFALGVWDARARELWLVRDRIGIKPVYWSRHHGRLVFASEIKALLRDPEQERAVDELALFHYLSFITTPAPMTMFQGVRKLPPGSLLRVRANGDIEERRWWDVWDHTEPHPERTEGEWTEEILATLRESVKLRKVSDVPVGVFLSGGVDSSANAALFSEGESGHVKTFTVGWQGEHKNYPSEIPLAAKVAARYGAEHIAREISQDELVDFLPRMVVQQDEPLGDPVLMPLYVVSQLARDNGVIVCQVGEGADELFWGYRQWKPLWLAQKAVRRGAPVWRAAASVLGRMGPGLSLHTEFLSRAGARRPIFWTGAEGFTHAQKLALLTPRMRRDLRDRHAWDVIAPIHARFQAKAWEKSTLHWMSYMDLSLRLPELLLMRVDKMSMLASIEARVPYLDHKFVQLALSIPESLKTRGLVSKGLLKKAVRGLVPDEIIDRPKQGFDVPVHSWVQSRLGAEIESAVREFTDATDFLDQKAALATLRGGRPKLAWFLANVALWWKHVVVADRR